MSFRGGFLRGFGTDLWNSASAATAGIDRAINEERISLAITGLSRAGKTAFITSAIQNLLALGQRKNTLPRLAERLRHGGASRLRRVRVLPAGAAVLPYFDQPAKLAQLAAEDPAWPPGTEDLAQVSLELKVERPSALGQRLGTRRMRLDILDYPGEWLLDLPLLDQSFAAWSAATMALMRLQPRRDCSEAFLAFAANLRPDDRVEDSILRRGHDLYCEALEACRTRHGLRYLQPGRFLCRGPRSDAPFLWFFPLETPPGAPSPGTVGAQLRDRFEAYKQDMRAQFFDTHFAAFDRQAMLVDVLGAIYAGRAAFDDTVRAVHEIGRALRYGSNLPGRGLAAGMVRGGGQILPSVLSGMADRAANRISGRIERVAFVATKADHVPAMQRDNLRNLLRTLAAGPSDRAAAGGADVSYEVAAAILSTQDGTTRIGDRPVEVVHGVKLGEDTVRPFYVGEVPSSLPPESFWSERYFEMPVFRPPAIDPTGRDGIPHLHLDHVLDDLIGDLL